MDIIFEAIFNFVIEVVKFTIYVVIWSHVLFFIGVAILKILTFFNYPTGLQFEKQINVISGVGSNAVYIFWACIATYNFSENIYLLVAGLVVAIFQALLIAIKYYSEYRNQYEIYF
ncbi:MAG: hypothetical protein QM487_11800 [Candidatus Marithrix sp.]